MGRGEGLFLGLKLVILASFGVGNFLVKVFG